MFCRNCGQKLADGDKFCSSCGTKTEMAENIAAEGFTASVEDVSPAAKAEDKPLFEPFDFKAFGFDFADLGLGTGAKKEETAGEEESKPTPPTEKFDWNTGAFPDTNKTSKTEDINFNWSLSPETPEPVAEPEVFKAEEPVWTEPVEAPVADLEAELFGDIESKADETRKQSEEIDKFFTFHKKNEEFQKILDREYEKVKTGNIITEEMNAADAVSEEKFTARQPEDPMEEMFAEAGVIKGYEPKPVETDVLERIEAAEAEKRIQEEAARLAEEKRAAMAAAEETAAAEPEAVAVEEVVAAEPEVTETVTEAAEPEAEEAPAVEYVAVESVIDEIETAEPVAAESAAEPVQTIEFDAEPVQEDVPEKTKQVDKAAILAEIALASEMVERDRAMAAAQEAAATEAAVAAVEELKVDIPDFLGHQEEEPAVEEISLEDVVEEAIAETPVEEPVEELIDVEAVIEEAAAAEPVAEEPEMTEAAEAEEEVEFDIFEQLEELETPAEEIVLKEPQTIEDLFAEIPTAETEQEEETVTAHTVVLTEDSVAEILKTVEEDTTKDDTMVFTAHALGALLAEAEQNDPDASEVVVSLEDLTALEQQAAEGTLPPVGAPAEETVEEEEEIKGGKGRTFLKVCLVILVILLVIEVAGVAIKIAAPTSGAANFIDNQLNKVFQLIGEEDTAPEDYNA